MSGGHDTAQPSPTAGMNIAQRILHVGGRNNAAGYVEFGSIQAVEALVRQVLRDLPALSEAAREVLDERQRQIEVERWTPEHDDGYPRGTLAVAAACYLLQAASDVADNAYWQQLYAGEALRLWPWDHEWWKPASTRRMTVKASALALAELERQVRAEARQATTTAPKGPTP